MKRFHRIAGALTLFVGAGVAGLLLSQDGLGQNQRKPTTKETPKPSAPAPSPPAQVPPEQPPAAPSPPAPDSQLSLPAQHAQKSGYTSCLTALDTATRDIVRDSPYAAANTWNNQAADTSSFTSVLAIDRPQSTAILTVSPTKSGGCDTAAAVFGYFVESCISVREARLQGWKLVWETKTLFGYQAPDSHLAYLMPSGSGCTVIEMHVQYGAAASEKK
ncbi:MAG TPA: hypothetical protein VK433_11535 [Stellaceae bacterium]|nr:hypothetical protein [Stellaceae bacterium]